GMVSARPPRPNARPRPTSRHDHARPRSIRGPLPRTFVISSAVDAASTVGTASATTSTPALGGPSPINDRLMTPETTRNTASARRYAPSPQRWVRVGEGAAHEPRGGGVRPIDGAGYGPPGGKGPGA